MTRVFYIGKTVTILNSNVSTKVSTTDLTTHIYQSNVHHDSQDIKWIKSDNMNKTNTDLNKTKKILLRESTYQIRKLNENVKLTRQKILYRALAIQ
jgi:hypothetical protein